ncbi:hypothetical protein B0H10DRAFT_1948748 [Mycena sp. CBHHK59/15]|nr:hypothetical protein B0H10DRAFT_1948748 [Mycena sp. CBHHK59/15]
MNIVWRAIFSGLNIIWGMNDKFASARKYWRAALRNKTEKKGARALAECAAGRDYTVIDLFIKADMESGHIRPASPATLPSHEYISMLCTCPVWGGGMLWTGHQQQQITQEARGRERGRRAIRQPRGRKEGGREGGEEIREARTAATKQKRKKHAGAGERESEDDNPARDAVNTPFPPFLPPLPPHPPPPRHTHPSTAPAPAPWSSRGLSGSRGAGGGLIMCCARGLRRTPAGGLRRGTDPGVVYQEAIDSSHDWAIVPGPSSLLTLSRCGFEPFERKTNREVRKDKIGRHDAPEHRCLEVVQASTHRVAGADDLRFTRLTGVVGLKISPQTVGWLAGLNEVETEESESEESEEESAAGILALMFTKVDRKKYRLTTQGDRSVSAAPV